MNTYKQQLANLAFKEPHVYPHLEDIQQNVTYALTINPSQSFDAYLDQHVHFEDNIKPHLTGIVELRPEISTKSILWHWHGTIRFANTLDIVKFYKSIKLLKQNCTFTLKPINEPDQWYLYCIKQRHLIKPYINSVYNIRKTLIPYKITIHHGKFIKN